MSNNQPSLDEARLDQALAEIRDEQLAPEQVAAATDRVWTRLTAELGCPTSERPLRSCEDFQTLIPAYVAGALPEARKILVGDHTRECVQCRRALISARSGEDIATFRAPRPRQRRRLPLAVRWAMAATVLIGLLMLGYGTTANLIADRMLSAEIELVDGGLSLVAEQGMRPLAVGDQISSRQQLRTEKGSGAMIRLTDGSVIEMAERSQLALRGSRRGTSIELDHGNVIVHAAKQRSGHLFVTTNDCTVAVKGTIFSVNHGFKGSRVSVIEGEVEVLLAEGRSQLLPGDQVSSSSKLTKVAVEDEIAWSRDHDELVSLLHELTDLGHEMADAADVGGLRTSTRLLDLCPADTVIYTAIPNLAEGLNAAHQVFEEHLSKSETLRNWWDEKISGSEMKQDLDSLLQRLQPFADALGDEMAAAIPTVAINNDGGPVLLASLDDAAAFAVLLQAELERQAAAGNPVPLEIIDDPWQADDSDAEWLLWVEGSVFAAAQDTQQLQRVAAAIADRSSNPFTQTALYSRLADAYDAGISWLVGVDVHGMLSTAMALEPEHTVSAQQVMEQIGLFDADTLIFERHRQGDQSELRAVLDFSGPRQGIAAWLAEPATIGSLEMISPDAAVASAVLTRDAADMFDDLLDMIDAANPGATDKLRQFEQTHDIDLRNDLAAHLGGEVAFALDGPMLPIPSWKLIVEVYHPEALHTTIAAAVTTINQLLVAEGKPGLTLSEASVGGRTYYTIRHQGTGLLANYLISDGYLIAAPQRALIDLALEYRSGTNLASSTGFQELIPSDGYNGFSAVVYRNLSRITEMIPPALAAQLPPQAAEIIAESSTPTLVCLYGEHDRITLGGTGSLLLSPAALFGFSSLLDEHG